MDDREMRQAVYMILTAVECYNDDPKGVGAVLEALGEPARSTVLSGSDEQKIRAVAQALMSERKEPIILAMQSLSLEFEAFEIEETIGGAAGAPAAAPAAGVDKRIRKLEDECDQLYEKLSKARTDIDGLTLERDTLAGSRNQANDEKQALERTLAEAQKKIASLEKKLEKKDA